MMNQLGYVCAIGSGLNLQAKFGHPALTVDLDLVFGYTPGATDDLLDCAGIDIDSSHQHHVIGAANDAALQGHIVAATNARR